MLTIENIVKVIEDFFLNYETLAGDILTFLWGAVTAYVNTPVGEQEFQAIIAQLEGKPAPTPAPTSTPNSTANSEPATSEVQQVIANLAANFRAGKGK